MLWGCAKKPEGDVQYVARVGDARLTSDELASAGASQAEHLSRQYVSNWVTNELLYQEARRNGFTEKDEVLRQVEDAKRQLVINAYLQKKIYSDVASDISDEALSTEFREHSEAYRLRDEVKKISFAVFEERDAANVLRLKILRGAAWDQAVREMQADSETKQQVLRVVTQEYFTQSMLYPEELWKIARTLGKEDVSYVVKTNAGYCVVLVHATMRQGDVPDFEYAKNEVKERLMIERRRARYEELLATLQAKYDVDVRLDTADAAQNSNE